MTTDRMGSFHLAWGPIWVREEATGDDPAGSQNHPGSVATTSRQHTSRAPRTDKNERNDKQNVLFIGILPGSARN